MPSVEDRKPQATASSSSLIGSESGAVEDLHSTKDPRRLWKLRLKLALAGMLVATVIAALVVFFSLKHHSMAKPTDAASAEVKTPLHHVRGPPKTPMNFDIEGRDRMSDSPFSQEGLSNSDEDKRTFDYNVDGMGTFRSRRLLSKQEDAGGSADDIRAQDSDEYDGYSNEYDYKEIADYPAEINFSD